MKYNGKGDDVRFTVMLPRSLHAKLRDYCERSKLNMTVFIRLLLAQKLNWRPDVDNPTLEEPQD